MTAVAMPAADLQLAGPSQPQVHTGSTSPSQPRSSTTRQPAPSPPNNRTARSQDKLPPRRLPPAVLRLVIAFSANNRGAAAASNAIGTGVEIKIGRAGGRRGICSDWGRMEGGMRMRGWGGAEGRRDEDHPSGRATGVVARRATSISSLSCRPCNFGGFPSAWN